MKYDYENSYLRDAKKLPESLREPLQNVILSVKEAKTLKGIPNLKKLSGYKNVYRIRVGEYRIGLYVEEDTVVFTRILPRKEIYRFFRNQFI
jgi:mRNA interferase RelE/StbE